MTRMGVLRLTVMLGMASVALNGCRPEQPPAEDLLMVRMLGLDHLEKGELPEAEEQFKKIVALAPREPLGYANLGVTYLRAGRYEDAEAQLRRAQRLDPTSTQVGLTMAKLYSLTGRVAEARSVLERLLRGGAADAPVLYALAELDGQVADSAALRRREERLRQVVALAPANLAVRLELMESLARRGEADSVVRQLEEVRRIPPEPPQEARPHLERAIRLLRAGRLSEAATPLDRFVRMMELTPSYQASLADVSWIEGPLVGRPVLTYSPEFLVTLRAQGLELPAGVVSFTDATTDAGLPDPQATPASPGTEPSPQGDPHATVLALGDFSGDGTHDLIASSRPPDQQVARPRLYAGRGGHFLDVTERWGISLPASASHATVADFDNDGRLDLFLVGTDGRVHLLRNEGSGQFTDVTTMAGLNAVRGARSAVFVDLDHDGDLDLVLVGSEALVVFRNNLDGTFTDVTAGTGLTSADGPRAVAFGDFYDDGRIDLFVGNEHGPDILFRNTGGGRFSDRTAQSRITSGGSGAVAVGDFDNDGLLDVFVASATGGSPTLWRNNGDGTFAADDRSAAALEQLGSTATLAAEFVDYDNDGWLDLVVAGAPLTTGGPGGGTFLFHNDGRGVFTDRSEILPPTVRSGDWTTLAVSDFDGDGDQDLFVAGPQGVRLLRNEDGNAHLAMQVKLLALRDGSGKNNTFGIGANVELRAGDIYQTRVVTGPVTHFGLGPHLKGDVLRVQWPNGVPQTIYLPGTDQDVLELEHLKGSCPFLYTWDGERFRFVTDVMWRSALGMPLGIMSGGADAEGSEDGGTAWAPAAPSEEYLRIPGDALRPRDGRYVLQFTEELWETAYLDEIQLLAVDHPDSVDVFVDERFVPPAPADLRLFPVVRPRVPRSATNERGEDLLPALRANDDMYVSNLTPLRYQGLVEPHDLILDLGEEVGTPGSFLFLRGWIYPGDASINVALAQQSRLQARSPSLEVRDAQGSWVTAIEDIGFPSGKDKTIVIDLAGKFPTDDSHVRIRTNMQIYWGHAFVSVDAAQTPLRVTPLPLLAADLQYRGFSRMYRRGGRYGPHWFDYDDVTPESPWRPIEGAFTRFGDVLPLLSSADDMYAIMGPGDGITLAFDAASEQALPPGWTRTFLLYTVGWIKDADLNTAFGNTVEPLPFHGLQQYPYAPGESYPADSALHRYRQEYNTRVVKLR